MRNVILHTFIIAFLALPMLSCSSVELVSEPELEIMGGDINCPLAGGEFTLSVNLPDFKVSSDQNWCVVGVSTNGEVSLTVEATKEMKKRTATVVVTSGEQTCSTSVVQSGYEDGRNVIYTKKSFNALNSSYSETKFYSKEYFAVSYCDWITTDCSDGKMKYAVTENPGLDQRIGRVVFVDESTVEYFIITQDGRNYPELKVIEEAREFTAEGGEGYFVLSRDDYSVILGQYVEYTDEQGNVWYPPSTCDWISYKQEGAKLIITVQPNTTTESRSVPIHFKVKYQMTSLFIKQPGVAAAENPEI